MGFSLEVTFLLGIAIATLQVLIGDTPPSHTAAALSTSTLLCCPITQCFVYCEWGYIKQSGTKDTLTAIKKSNHICNLSFFTFSVAAQVNQYWRLFRVGESTFLNHHVHLQLEMTHGRHKEVVAVCTENYEIAY